MTGNQSSRIDVVHSSAGTVRGQVGRVAERTHPIALKRRLPSVRPPPADGRPKNRLLAPLPAGDFGRLVPYLTTVPIRVTQVLHKNGDRLRAVYFPNGGVASISTILADGTAVEAATVGDEGMVGLEAFFGVDAIAPGEALIQVPDTSAEMMSVEDFRRESGAAGAFHEFIGH